MSLTAAAGGFVVLLLTVPVVQGQDGWGVTYSATELCVPKGSTVEIHCTYRYSHYVTTVQKRFWFTKQNHEDYVDLETDPAYSGRVQYDCRPLRTCTLRINNLRKSDSAEYKFRFITNQKGGQYTGVPGVTLFVTDEVHVTTRINEYSTETELSCQSSCPRHVRPSSSSYIWYKNGHKLRNGETYSHQRPFDPTDKYHCAIEGQESLRSPPVYAPNPPSVTVSPSDEVEEGHSVTLTCSSDANPAANYTWYKINGNPELQPVNEASLSFSSIQSSDSGTYYCTAENDLGNNMSELSFIDVKYAPKLPSVSVSPSGEIVEGSSVTLTCSSDANPAASCTWYKENQTLLQGPEGVYHFPSLISEDRGFYHCKCVNQYGQINSSTLLIDVHYAPKLPSVSVSPSGEIVEGSSVTLTCSSDANPAANYTWYKEDEDSAKASGQIFIITNIRAEHSGSYYCEAQNSRGRHNSTFHLTVVTGKTVMILNIIRLTLVVLMLIPLCVSFFNLWMRKKQKSLSLNTEPKEAVEVMEMQLKQRQDSPDGNRK